MKKKLISLLLIACMLVPLLPALPFSAAAQEGTLGDLGSSTTLYDDIKLSETALPVNYATYLSEGMVGLDGYRTYLESMKNVTWSDNSNWTMGAVVDAGDGTYRYEKMEYIISMGNTTIDATAWTQSAWHTTASGFDKLLDVFMAGEAASIWGVYGTVLTANGDVVKMRMPGNDTGAIGAYAYTVPASGVIGFSISLDDPEPKADSGFPYTTAIASGRVLIRVNDEIVFPAGATMADRDTWAAYDTVSAFNDAIKDLRYTAEAGDVVQFCIREKGSSDPKLGLNPIVSTYESTDAAAIATSEVIYYDAAVGATYSRTEPLPAVYSVWNTTGSQEDTEANRTLYRNYLLTCGKLTQSGNWQIGGYTGENGAFEPIAYRIPFTTNKSANITTDTSWSNRDWYTTASAYARMTQDYIDGVYPDSIWSYTNAVVYQKAKKRIRTAVSQNSTFVYRYTVPSGAGGQITPTFASDTAIASTATALCIVYDGTVIWPEGASLSDRSTWATGYTTADQLNAALDGLFLDVEAGKTLDFCGTGNAGSDTLLNPTLTYTSTPLSSLYTEDATFTDHGLPMTYSAFLTDKGLTDGDDALAAFKTYLQNYVALEWSGNWSRGAIDMTTGAYEKLDRRAYMYSKKFSSTTTWQSDPWTTTPSSYAKMLDIFFDSTTTATPSLWTAGYVLQSLNDTLLFRLTGNTTAAGIFAYAYEIPADGGGLVGFSASTESIVKVNRVDGYASYENIDKMYVCIMVNGTPVWPQGATRASIDNWATPTDVNNLNALLAEARVYTEPGDLVQLCVRENDPSSTNYKLSFDPCITFYSSTAAMSDGLTASLSLGTALSLDINAVCENETVMSNLVVTLNGSAVAPTQTVENRDGSINAVWTKSGIAAKEMSDHINYSFTNKTDGHVYYEGTTSLAKLLAQHLVYNTDNTVDTTNAAAALAMATLNYGAAAQTYFGYNTENLANAVLKVESDRVTGSPILNGSFAAEVGLQATEGAVMHWNAATLLLDDVVRIKLLIDADSAVDPATLTLKTIEEDGVAVESEWQIVSRGNDTTNKYFKVLIDVPMINYRAGLTLGVYQNGTLISDLLSYGVGAYACRVYDDSESPDAEAQKLNTMVDTILVLGEMADAYHVEEVVDYTQIATVRELESNLLVTPSVIQDVDSRVTLVNILAQSPSHALLRLNKDLYVVNANGEPIATLAYALECLDNCVIPVLAPLADAYDALYTYFEGTKHSDIMLLSDNVEQINNLKSVQPLLRSIYDARTADLSDLAAIRANAMTCSSYVCLLPASAATTETTQYFTVRSMLAWYEAADASDKETVRLVTAGASGILTDNRTALEACLCNDALFAEKSMVRAVEIVGHQGSTFNPTTQPNTIGACEWAIENGAKLVEMDVYFTADETPIPVIMHDTTIDGTTNGSGYIEQMTLEELRQYQVDCHANADPAEIPTLEDYFVQYKGKDVILYIEIKSGKTDLLYLVTDLIEEYGIGDQCCFICFNGTQLKALRELMPSVACGWVDGSGQDLNTVLSNTSSYQADYHPRYDLADFSLVQKLAYRGIATSPWTPDTDVAVYSTYAKGLWTLTLNYVDKTAGLAKTLTTDSTSYTLTAGGSAGVLIESTTYAGTVTDACNAAEMVIISGNETLSYASGTLTATAAGEAVVMFRMPVALGSTGITVYIYTAPVTVTVN